MVLLDPDARNSLEIRIECNFAMPKSHLAVMKLGGAVSLPLLRAAIIL